MEMDPISSNDPIERALWEAEDIMHQTQEDLKQHIIKTAQLRKLFAESKAHCESLRQSLWRASLIKQKKRKLCEEEKDEEIPTQIC